MSSTVPRSAKKPNPWVMRSISLLEDAQKRLKNILGGPNPGEGMPPKGSSGDKSRGKETPTGDQVKAMGKKRKFSPKSLATDLEGAAGSRGQVPPLGDI
ncbi:hypothetical protein ACOSP7_019695 [Xanthoceras sorbifolium]